MSDPVISEILDHLYKRGMLVTAYVMEGLVKERDHYQAERNEHEQARTALEEELRRVEADRKKCRDRVESLEQTIAEGPAPRGRYAYVADKRRRRAEAERDEYHRHLTVIAEMTGDEGDIGAAWESVNALQEALVASEKREQALAARCTEVEQLRDRYREEARHLHWKAANAASDRDNALAERDTAEVERGRFSRMFAQACETLGAVQDALGNSDEPEGIGLEPELVRGLMAERDALAAHVERLREVLRKIADTGDAIKCRELAGDACDDTPATSLACLKAEWQAEALEALSRAKGPNGSPPEGDSFTAGWDAAFESVDSEAARYRRQAQEGQL